MHSAAKHVLKYILIAAFWIALWQLIALKIHNALLIPQPGQVAARLWALSVTGEFWQTVGASLLRICFGFLSGVLLGAAAGILTAKIPLSGSILSPMLTIMKTTPVASFIILALVWMKNEAVPVFISFLMVFPILQSNVDSGIRSADPKLLEMARVYHVPAFRRFRALILPAVMPYFNAGCRTSLGLAWKAGVAAEVISVPMLSIGRQIYFSKLYLETTDVFAWTAAVILLSLIIEKLLSALLGRLAKNAESS